MILLLPEVEELTKEEKIYANNMNVPVIKGIVQQVGVIFAYD